MSARSCVFYSLFEIDCYVVVSLVLFTLLSQTKLRYTPFCCAIKFDCHCNIHQILHFCNKNTPFLSKNMFCSIIFLFPLEKSIANCYTLIYNNTRDGAWCSGSTWASDSHCVGSIPIAPANANTLTCEGVSFIFGALYACIRCAPNIKET